jgi:hypothetical protein
VTAFHTSQRIIAAFADHGGTQEVAEAARNERFNVTINCSNLFILSIFIQYNYIILIHS